MNLQSLWKELHLNPLTECRVCRISIHGFNYPQYCLKILNKSPRNTHFQSVLPEPDTRGNQILCYIKSLHIHGFWHSQGEDLGIDPLWKPWSYCSVSQTQSQRMVWVQGQIIMHPRQVQVSDCTKIAFLLHAATTQI